MHLKSTEKKSERLLSLDFMRGLIMVLLALESTELYEHLRQAIPGGSWGNGLIRQFFHNQWEGLHFWDLVQPAFMFMAGVAMAYSLTKQARNGHTWNQRFIKILKRCVLLLLWGLFKRIYQPNWFALNVLDVTDILTQLAFTTLIAFALFQLSIRMQILGCLIILLLTECLYRFWSVSGFDLGYVDGHNFGNYMDWLLLGQKSKGYVFINWLPTAVHTIVGTIVGKQFMQSSRPLQWIISFGIGLLIVGYGLDIAHITPIIKPIASSSFVIASLGYCLIILAAIYWWVDIKKHQRGLLFFLIIGMNSIFIYLLCDIVGRNWLNDYVAMIVHPVQALLGLTKNGLFILAALITFALEWGVCYFLYLKKIFFKL
ncbi:MAG TPA: DUF5009 domain-containing protein [Arachidicoccus sp.]|nr:DUF5009 domain-containing protein [Arachidicoccus sp.]